jgi:hypothetical protein
MCCCCLSASSFAACVSRSQSPIDRELFAVNSFLLPSHIRCPEPKSSCQLRNVCNSRMNHRPKHCVLSIHSSVIVYLPIIRRIMFRRFLSTSSRILNQSAGAGPSSVATKRLPRLTLYTGGPECSLCEVSTSVVHRQLIT